MTSSPSRTAEAFIRPHTTDRQLPGLVNANELVVVVDAGEITLKHVLGSPSRQMGPCDGDTRICDGAYIAANAVSEQDTGSAAATRTDAAPWLMIDGRTLLGHLDLTLTDSARRWPGATIRLLDLRRDHELDGPLPTVEQLRAPDAEDSPEWRALTWMQTYHDLVGFVLTSSENGVVVILNVRAIVMLVEAGYVTATITHEPVDLGWTDRLRRRAVQHTEINALFVQVLEDNTKLAHAFRGALAAWCGRGHSAMIADGDSCRQSSRTKRRVGIAAVVTAAATIIAFLQQASAF